VRDGPCDGGRPGERGVAIEPSQPARTAGEWACAIHPTMDRKPGGLQQRTSRGAARASVRWPRNPLCTGWMGSFAACADQLVGTLGTWLCAATRA